MPGRALTWLFTPEQGIAQQFSMNVVNIRGGETVRPAHSHVGLEEVIYIISGEGQVFIDGEISEIAAGTAVRFPPDSVHQVRNVGTEDMKVVCFFTPPATFENYQFHEGVGFPDEAAGGTQDEKAQDEKALDEKA
jgi:mannose-6-phosphate isomerase-like protein (cupin superfamily)